MMSVRELYEQLAAAMLLAGWDEMARQVEAGQPFLCIAWDEPAGAVAFYSAEPPERAVYAVYADCRMWLAAR